MYVVLQQLTTKLKRTKHHGKTNDKIFDPLPINRKMAIYLKTHKPLGKIEINVYLFTDLMSFLQLTENLKQIRIVGCGKIENSKVTLAAILFELLAIDRKVFMNE